MKLRFVVATVVAVALGTAVVAQEQGDVQAPSPRSVLANIPSDNSDMAEILETKPSLPLGPRDVLREYEQEMASISQRTSAELAQIAEAARQGQISRDQAEYFSGERYQLGMMRFQLFSALHQSLEDEIEKAARAAQRQHSQDTVLVPPPFSPDDVPQDLIRYLDLTPVQVGAIRGQIALERRETSRLIEALANNRRALISATLKGRFDEKQVHVLAAEQSRILEQLIVANVRLQTKVYKALNAGQQQQIDEIREQAATAKPSFAEW